MRDFSNQATHALRVYLERGRSALQKLEEGQFDDAIEILRWRDAAYHNFRVIDALGLKAGVDVTQEESVRAIWSEIRVFDSRLKPALEKAKEITAEQANKLRKMRQKITSYRSGNQDKSRFEHSV
jgi:hypothetical protein